VAATPVAASVATTVVVATATAADAAVVTRCSARPYAQAR
jgi:hypothetical protein